MKTKPQYLRGEVYLCNLGEKQGSTQSGLRPVVIVQNNYGNLSSPTVIVAPITSKKKKNILVHVPIQLEEESIILCEQITTVDKKLLGDKVYYLSGEQLAQLDHALVTSLGL